MPQATFVQDGCAIDYTPGAAIAAGDVVVQGDLVGVAKRPIAANDLPALAAALEKTASFAPAGYTNWVAVSKDGAKAARGGDMTAAKASCRTCHDQYKDKYKKEMRARKI